MDMEMPAAMSPYSTAVAPDSSLTNFTRIVILQRLQSVLAAGKLPPVLLWLSRCGAELTVSSRPCVVVNLGKSVG
jgi:hypothetical protein